VTTASAEGALAEGALARVERTRSRARGIVDAVFRVMLLATIAVAVVGLAVLLVYVVTKGWPRLDSRLINNFPSSTPERAGARSAIFGTLWIMGLTALFTIPLGVGAATYLEEFAPKDRWYTRLIELNIQNLAAVPSIVFGILGLAFVVRGPLDLGPVILAGGIILSLVVLPTVIIAAREALRAVPPSIREGAMALGATRWQAVSRQVLPPSVPGIATGIILGLSRAIGEAAPLLMVGALTFVPFTPTGLDSAFAVLPVQIFQWIARPQEEFRVLAAAAIIVLLAILLTMNAIAIWLRNRYARKW
jgi:phosphate transport system permease protein